MKRKLVGYLYREERHAKASAGNDQRILDLLCVLLREADVEVEPVSYDMLSSEQLKRFDLLLSMSRAVENLEQLAMYAEGGLAVINAPRATIGTLRKNMYPLFRHVGVPMPDTISVPVGGNNILGYPVWVKREDYHHLDLRDVMLVQDSSEYAELCDYYRSIGSKNLFLQRPVIGQRVKFYGVYDRFKNNIPFLQSDVVVNEALCEEVKLIALWLLERVGIEFFGIDLIYCADSSFFLVDLNSWPSFKDCADDAASAMAKYVKNSLGCV